jgi:PAS domain S-box-containing protein
MQSTVTVVLLLAVLAAVLLSLRELRALRRRSASAGHDRRRVAELEELLAIIPDPLIVLDYEANYLDEYPATNKTRARGILESVSEVERAALREQLRAAIDSQRRQFHRFQLDGRTIMAEILPLRPVPERPAAAAVCLRDITEQQESAARLDRLAARNRAILRSAMDGFFVVDQNQRFLEVNDAFCRMTGYRAAELLGMRITDLEVKEPPQDRATISPLRTGLHQFATAHRHRDGHIIRLETSVIVLRDEDRKILVGFARDVTERLRAEEALERLSHQNKLILDSAAEGIYGVDTSGRCTFANPAAARMLGWEVSDLIGRSSHELVRHGRLTSDVNPDDNCTICSAVRKGAVQHGSNEVFIRKDGSTFPIDFVSAPIREQGRLTGAVVVFRDISERQRAEEERRQLEVRMQQAQKLDSLGMLAGGLAHDFNNLLLSVLCNASVAMERAPANSDLRGHLEKIIKSGQRASELTRQMLAYSGQAAYDVHPLALSELVEEIADLMRAALPKTVNLQLELANDLPMIQADGSQLQQVIMNLLLNAAEAIGHQPGTVVARTELRPRLANELDAAFIGHPLTPGQYVCLEVADTGCGMSTDTLARIFDPFFSTKAKGRGLGLSALLGIVRSHHGAVRVTSTVGRGTTFTILFPPAVGTIRRPVSRLQCTTLPVSSTVLVVDDEEDIREVVQTILESRGARVLTASDGVSGIELFRRHADEINVVLLDMTMPGMGGETVLQRILDIRPDARVILSSGYSEQEALAHLDGHRMAGFVPKPYTAQALIDSIGSALTMA